jgi:hypothetical protein
VKSRLRTRPSQQEELFPDLPKRDPLSDLPLFGGELTEAGPVPAFDPDAIDYGQHPIFPAICPLCLDTGWADGQRCICRHND